LKGAWNSILGARFWSGLGWRRPSSHVRCRVAAEEGGRNLNASHWAKPDTELAPKRGPKPGPSRSRRGTNSSKWSRPVYWANAPSSVNGGTLILGLPPFQGRVPSIAGYEAGGVCFNFARFIRPHPAALICASADPKTASHFSGRCEACPPSPEREGVARDRRA
jgi:hypothetical protein